MSTDNINTSTSTNTSTQYNSDAIQAVSLDDLLIPSENATNEEIDQFLKNVEKAGIDVNDPDDDRITYISKDEVPKEHFGIIKFGDLQFTTPINYTVREYDDEYSHYQSVVYNDSFVHFACSSTSINEIDKWNEVDQSAYDEMCEIMTYNAFPSFEFKSYENTTNQGDYTGYSSTVVGTSDVTLEDKEVGMCDIEIYYAAPYKDNVMYTMVVVEPRNDEYKLPAGDKEKFITGFKSINNVK